MNAKTLAELALKIWAVTVLLGAVLSLPSALWMFAAADGSGPESALVRATQTSYVLDIFVRTIAAFAVLVWADRIVALFEGDTTPVDIGAAATELQVLGFSLVGMFVLVDGLGDAAAAAYVLFTKPEFDETGTWSYMWAHQGEAMVRAIVEIAAGALLVFGRDAIVRGWLRLRGQTASESAEDDVSR